MTVVVPETPLDLVSILCDNLELPAKEVEKFFDVEIGDGKFILKVQRDSKGKPVWLDRSIWTKVNDYVRELRGAWDPQAKLWEIPTHSKSIDGEYQPNVLTISTIEIESLLSLPFQVRTWDQDPTLAEMAETIKQHGLLQPLVVRPRSSGVYEIVNGERRLKACKLAGLKEVPCVVRSLSDQEAYECQMIENIQRKDLSDIEKAHWLKHMLEKFPEAYPTQRELAKTIGKSEYWVSNHLRMLNLEKNFSREKLQGMTEGQAREILATPPEKRDEIVEKITEKTTPHKVEEPLPNPVECSLCGVQTFFPIMFNDKPFCGEKCLEKAKESGKLKAPSARQIREMREPPEREVPETKPQPLLSGFDIECPECHTTLLIEHQEFPDGKINHKIVGEKQS